MSRRRERRKRDIERELDEADVAHGYPWFRAWFRDPLGSPATWFSMSIGAESIEDVEHLIRVRRVPAQYEWVILPREVTP